MAAIRCYPTVLINNQLYNQSYEDLLRSDMMELIFPKAETIINQAIKQEKRGVDSECLWTQVNYYYALIDYFIAYRREINTYLEENTLTKTVLENLETEWKSSCIRAKLTCLYGEGTLFDNLSSIIQVGFDGLDFMILEGDNDINTPDFLIP